MRWVRRRGAWRGWALLAATASLAAACPLACGDLGVPAFEDSDGAILFDAGAPVPEPMDAMSEGDAATTELRGLVLDPMGAPLPGALVAIEVGGLNQPIPGAVAADGGAVGTLKIDPFYRLGAIADDAGQFALEVPDDSLGVHVYAAGFLCGVPDAGAIAAEAGTVTIRPAPAPPRDGGTGAPVIAEFTIAPSVVAPGETLTFAALVNAVDPRDPLSAQVLAIEPTSGWAGIFAPPTPGTAGVGYPNGVYGRLAPAPMVPGLYRYHVVAATESCIVSDPVTQEVLVTASGEGGLDAEDEVLPDGAGVREGGGDLDGGE